MNFQTIFLLCGGTFCYVPWIKVLWYNNHNSVCVINSLESSWLWALSVTLETSLRNKNHKQQSEEHSERAELLVVWVINTNNQQQSALTEQNFRFSEEQELQTTVNRTFWKPTVITVCFVLSQSHRTCKQAPSSSLNLFKHSAICQLFSTKFLMLPLAATDHLTSDPPDWSGHYQLNLWFWFGFQDDIVNFTECGPLENPTVPLQNLITWENIQICQNVNRNEIKQRLRPKFHTIHYILNMCTIVQHTFEWITAVCIFSDALFSAEVTHFLRASCRLRHVSNHGNPPLLAICNNTLLIHLIIIIL